MESEENAERQANSLDHGPGIKSKKSELHEKEIVKLIYRSVRYINQNHLSAFYNNNSIIVILYNYISYYIPEPGYL